MKTNCFLDYVIILLILYEELQHISVIKYCTNNLITLSAKSIRSLSRVKCAIWLSSVFNQLREKDKRNK